MTIRGDHLDFSSLPEGNASERWTIRTIAGLHVNLGGYESRRSLATTGGGR